MDDKEMNKEYYRAALRSSLVYALALVGVVAIIVSLA
jgi:hypothetical protein